MFIRSTLPVIRTSISHRHASSGGLPSKLMKNVWQKSTPMYVAYVIVGCVVVEFVYGSVTNCIWEKYNYGVRYFN